MANMTDDFDDGDDELFASISLDEHQNKQISSTCKASVEPPVRHLPAVLDAADSKEPELTPPETFPFPFEPYTIQTGFMKSLYLCLERGNIGIFESPTGTGKSLSLICGALQWLADHEERQQEKLAAILNDEQSVDTGTSGTKKEQELDWITDFAQKKEKEETSHQLKLERDHILKRRARAEKIKNSPRYLQKKKSNKLDDDFKELYKDQSVIDAENTAIQTLLNDDSKDEDDTHLVVADYFSDEEGEREDKSDEEEDDLGEDHLTKIYYCSRTHSQLSQFVHEVQKSPFGENAAVTSLASRQNMCINDAVRRLKSVSLINDRCLELQKKKKGSTVEGNEAKKQKTSGGCPFYKQNLMQHFGDNVLASVRDIEELVKLGKKLNVCPYYGARFAIPSAQFVALPYNTLLHKSTREACGIRLSGNIVIIDEAHNLVETINNIHSVQITGSQLTKAHSQLSQYLDRYKSRLKAKNLMYIRQLLFLMKNLIHCLGGKLGLAANTQYSQKKGSVLKTLNDFLFDSKLDNINLFKVLRYCQRSQIARKLHGFVEKYQPPIVPKIKPCEEEDKEEAKKNAAKLGVTTFLKEITGQTPPQLIPDESAIKSQPTDKTAQSGSQGTTTSCMMVVESFLEALTNVDKDGRIVVTIQGVLAESSLKFLHLNPSVHFTSVLTEARAVVVAGGTMQPVSEFRDQLFHSAGIQSDKIMEYTCGHVIPEDHLLPIALSTGPTGIQFDFTYESRDNPKLLDELGRCLINVCSAVPGGVVCFFPSYDYEQKVYTHWQKTGVLDRLQAKKKIFREPKLANQVEQVLTEYSSCIKKSSVPSGNPSSSSGVTGAMLLCVVGGKMSEGINFADDMGRCVVMVGLPFPNLYSPELREKMNYLNKNLPKTPEGKLPGQVHYENLCMKAVNQSIGRAIRHKDDYASIVLLDQRYSRPNIISKLPTWISRYIHTCEKFGKAFAAIHQFFSDKKKKKP